MFIYFTKENPELLKKAQEVFGEDLVVKAHTLIQCHESVADDRKSKTILLQAAAESYGLRGTKMFSVFHGEQIMLEFSNGKKVLFETSEAVYFTDANREVVEEFK